MTWYYKSDLRFKGDVGWTAYSEEDSDAIEQAYQSDAKVYKLNDKYKIAFENMFQYRINDETKQRDIKREEKKVKKHKKEDKKQHQSILGKIVWILTERKENNKVKVVGVFADKDEANEMKTEKRKSKETSSFKVFEQTIQ